MSDKSISVSEAGRLGGNKRKLDADFSAMGKKGGEVTRRRYGSAHYHEMARKSVESKARARAGPEIEYEDTSQAGH